MQGLNNFGASLGLPGAGSPSAIYGTKPTVPNLGAEQQKAIGADVAALPGLEGLASSVNQFTQAQKNQMLSFVTPDWQKNLGLAGEDISKMLQGELPTSDIAMSQLSSVSSALGAGTGGTGMMGNLVARDLGLRQQDIINKGLSANEAWLKTAESLTAPQFDFTKMFISPEQQFQRDWQQSLITAAPDPVARGESDAWNALIGEVLSIYGGGAGYQGTYRPNYGGGGGGGGYVPPNADLNSYFTAEPSQSDQTFNINVGGGDTGFGSTITSPGVGY